jgi:hypothetical protein
MIPLLIILNYIILDRFQYYVKNLDNKEEKSLAKDKGIK